MSVTTKHPTYSQHLPEWKMMEEAVAGEVAIKANTANLPKPAGMIEAEKDDPLSALYPSYTQRAQYEHWVKDGLRTMVGLVSRLQPEIKLPPHIAEMEDSATADGFGLRQLFVRTCREVLLYGRLGLLVDIDSNGKPFIAMYSALNIINWMDASQDGRQDLSMAVLAEARPKEGRDRFSHETEPVYRVIEMVDGQYISGLYKEDGTQIESEGAHTPKSEPLDFIPFVIAGSTDNAPDVDEIPLLTMAKTALKSYQISADLFTNAHGTCHAQPVVVGLESDKELRVTGPSAAWTLPIGGNAFYLEPSGAGSAINERLMAQQRNAALEAGARVIDMGGVESGEARKARQNDQHATLHTVVVTVAEAIEQCLRYAAQWVGAGGDPVFVVDPEFSNIGVDPQVAQQLLNAALAGIISHDTYWQYLSTGKVPQRTYDEEALHIENPGNVTEPSKWKSATT